MYILINIYVYICTGIIYTWYKIVESWVLNKEGCHFVKTTYSGFSKQGGMPVFKDHYILDFLKLVFINIAQDTWQY